MSDEPDITITIEFGDDDPEDAYCAEDSEEERLDVLERVVEHLRDHRDDRLEARRREALRALADIDETRSDRVSDRIREIRGALEELD
jgi:hypothetical protein